MDVLVFTFTLPLHGYHSRNNSHNDMSVTPTGKKTKLEIFIDSFVGLKKKKITKNDNPVSLLADDGTGDELLHDLVGSSVDRLNSRVHKCPENANMLMSWKKPQNNQSSLLQCLRDTNLAMGYSHMYPQPPWSCRH